MSFIVSIIWLRVTSLARLSGTCKLPSQTRHRGVYQCLRSSAEPHDTYSKTENNRNERILRAVVELIESLCEFGNSVATGEILRFVRWSGGEQDVLYASQVGSLGIGVE